MSPAGVRINNERAVLTAIATASGASAAELARRTGLVPQSVARILVDLDAKGLIVRGEARRGFRGQPATPLHINPQGAFALGCELGWRHYHILVRDLSGAVLGEHRRQFDYPHAETIFAEIASVAKLLINLIPEDNRDRILGIGLALPGSISRNINLIGAPASESEAWANIDVLEVARRTTGMPVAIFNDGNAACWGELVAMAPPRPKDLAYFAINTFILSGLIVDGHLWEGPIGNAANLGAMLVDDGSGQPKHIHRVASLYALEKMLIEAGLKLPAGAPAQWNWAAIEPVASTWVKQAGRALAFAIANAQAVAEFGTVVMSGALPDDIMNRLMDEVHDCFRQWPALTSDYPVVTQGTLGEGAAAMGAALMPIYRRFFSRQAADMGL